MIAAGRSGMRGRRVLLLERNEKLGKKLFITGKGRCNITNAADIETFIQKTVRNPKFLYSSFYTFTNDDLISLLKEQGLKVKTERGGRIFPDTNKAYDVIDALKKYVKAGNVQVKLNTRIKNISVATDGTKTLSTFNGEHYHAHKVLIATGGASYPSTGSTGDGYDLARQLGHTVIDIEPSLVPVYIEEEWPKELQGLTLRNVRLSIDAGDKNPLSEFGEMTFMQESISGPIVLTLSAFLKEYIKTDKKPSLVLDLKPALSDEKLDKRIQRDFQKFAKKQFRNSLHELLPRQMIPIIVRLSGIDPEKKSGQLNREERLHLLKLLKNLRMSVSKLGSFKEALITSGGIATGEIDPSTMQSKLVPGLYFAGEIIDVDAVTGGFNLQIAFSTGYIAGDCM